MKYGGRRAEGNLEELQAGRERRQAKETRRKTNKAPEPKRPLLPSSTQTRGPSDGFLLLLVIHVDIHQSSSVRGGTGESTRDGSVLVFLLVLVLLGAFLVVRDVNDGFSVESESVREEEREH